MQQKIIRQEFSPLNKDQSVLTLACGHLWSWSREPLPETIDCIHCDMPREDWWLA